MTGSTDSGMQKLRSHTFVLWLLLAGLFFRAGLPTGYMWASPQSASGGVTLVLCSGGIYKSLGNDDAAGKHASGDSQSCPYAAAAAPGLPVPATFHLRSFTTEAVSLAVRVAAFDSAGNRPPPARGPPLLS